MIPKILSRVTNVFFKMQNLYDTNIQDLPDELVFEIFSYLPLINIVPLQSQCILFHNTVVRMVVRGVKNLPKRITYEIENVKKEMKTSSASADSSRLDFSTVLTYLRCMLIEAALLRATVGHYLENEFALEYLLEPLSQVLNEFYNNFVTLKNSSVRKVIRANYSSPGITIWNNFLKTFDISLRPKIEEASNIIVPLGVVIADLLQCSVSANIQTNLSCLFEEDKYSLNMFFQLKDISHKGIPCSVNDEWTDAEKQNYLIKYLRSLIRYESRDFVCKYVREINDLENVIVLSGPNVVLEDVFIKLQNSYSTITNSPFKTVSHFLSPVCLNSNVYNEIFYRANDWDTTKTGITIAFKMVTDKTYFPLDYNYKTNEMFYISKVESPEYNSKREILPTNLGMLIHLSEIPNIDKNLLESWSISNNYCDINICVQYDPLFVLSPLVIKEAEVIFNQSNHEITLIHKDYEIVMV